MSDFIKNSSNKFSKNYHTSSSVADNKVKSLPPVQQYTFFGPRIGVYYGVVVDQDHLEKKLEPIEIANLIEMITGLSPLTLEAPWKLDYDHSQCYKTFVIYHQDYTKITPCPGFIGGWSANGNTKQVPIDVLNMAETLSSAIEKILYPYVNDDTSYAIVAVGYCALYFVD